MFCLLAVKMILTIKSTCCINFKRYFQWGLYRKNKHCLKWIESAGVGMVHGDVSSSAEDQVPFSLLQRCISEMRSWFPAVGPAETGKRRPMDTLAFLSRLGARPYVFLIFFPCCSSHVFPMGNHYLLHIFLLIGSWNFVSAKSWDRNINFHSWREKKSGQNKAQILPRKSYI